jgi:hypothetical protein
MAGLIIWSACERGSGFEDLGTFLIFASLIFGFAMGGGLIPVEYESVEIPYELYGMPDSTIIVVAYGNNSKMVDHISDPKLINAVNIDSFKLTFDKEFNSYGGNVGNYFTSRYIINSEEFTTNPRGTDI